MNTDFVQLLLPQIVIGMNGKSLFILLVYSLSQSSKGGLDRSIWRRNRKNDKLFSISADSAHCLALEFTIGP